MYLKEKSSYRCRYREGNSKKGYVCWHKGFCQYWESGPFPCKENYKPIKKIGIRYLDIGASMHDEF